MGGIKNVASAVFPVHAIANQGSKGKNKAPPDFLSGPAAGAVGAVSPGLTTAMGQSASYDPSQQITNAINANWEQAQSRLDPVWQQRQKAFASQMANQGLDPGTAAYDASAGTLNRAQNDAYESALRGAITQGNETARTAYAGQMLPFAEFGSLMGSGSLGYGAGLDRFNAEQMGTQGLLSGLGGLGSLAATRGGKGKAAAAPAVAAL